jgi:hypothetical protein
MSYLAEHEKECVEILGEPFTEVHKFLDQYAFTYQYGMRHRHKLHHLQGIEEVRSLYGDKAAEAAKLHILADLALEGFPNDEDLIPKNEKHYKAIGLF